jgi:hypothetical protein
MKKFYRAILSRAWWSSPLTFKRALLTLLFLTVPIAVLAVPAKVSVDSIWFILGAKTLFSSDFSTLYPLFREPGYSVFLRLAHVFSGSSLPVVAAQAAMLAFAGFAAIYVLHRALGQPGIPRYVVAIVIALVLNPVYLTYSGHFLQQPLFAAFLGSFAILVEWSRRPPARIARWHLVILLGLLNLASVLTSILWLYAALFPTVLALGFLFVPLVKKLTLPSLRNGSRRSLQIVSSVLLLGALTLATYAVDRGVYRGWEVFRDAQTGSISPGIKVLSPLTAVPSLPRAQDIVQLYGSLIGVGVWDPYPRENDDFLALQMRLSFPYSEWDTAYIREPFTSEAQDFFQLGDPSLVAHSIYALATFPPTIDVPIASIAYSGTIVLGHIVIFFALVRRQWVVVALMLIPVSYLAIHALNGTPIDRYGLPTYPFFAAAVALMCNKAYWRRLSSTGLRRQTR